MHSILHILERPEWVAAILTAIYVGFTIRYVSISKKTLDQLSSQGEQTKSQIELLKTQLDMQGAALRQWLITHNWHVELDMYGSLIVTFEAINGTLIPLWLDKAVIGIGGGRFATKEVSAWLIPNNPQRIGTSLSATQQEQEAYRLRRFSTPIYASLFFTDALKKEWQQDIELVIFSNLGTDNVTEYRNRLFQTIDTVP